MERINNLYLAESDEERIVWYQTGHKGQQPGDSPSATAPVITVTDP